MTRRQFMKVSVGLGAAVGVKAQAKVSQQPLTRRCEPIRGDQKRITLPAKVIEDKIRGGLVGQLLGNLNGLPHEFKYLDEPGDVRDYLPALPQGAWTDDDTDIEWVYVLQMQKQHTLFVPHREIPRLWQSHINRRIWSSNLYARQLMDLGIEPPDTGLPVLNPWAEFNIAGQFCSETFGFNIANPSTNSSENRMPLYIGGGIRRAATSHATFYCDDCYCLHH
ncbi:hypothetical protein Q2T83_05640 [Fervidibacter sacchari]|uniref:Twin-arginine translocation signal domain-containing protein n=1 Tax=Candidatus Fervidibacter sacchari TaxID=1448929 RepID=A0ABT2ELY8_9BACT|nr:hypothetical protein [Candidatus Fervidibacter sacchari]MCS3918959.1 hypothetical protein [Candidatus Fervidibacter sacchari]WKU17304.1 hypothetical protein Q2T83_05640 [Candidatus Fervidibacter sacchari]